MSAQTIFESVSPIIHTTEEVSYLQDGIDSLLKSLYRVDTSSSLEKINEHLPHATAEKLIDFMQKNNLDLKNTEEIRLLLSDLRDALESMKVVSLTLAFDPPQNTIDKLANMIKDRFGPSYILELSQCSGILGGLVMVVHGKYIDLSLKKKLDILFGAKKQEIATMIK